MTAILRRVAETSTTTGTGNFTLLGANTADFGPTVRSFADAAGNSANGLLFLYSINHRTSNEWEDGTGYVNASGELVRNQVYRSSNNNALVNFSVGTKDVVCADQGAVRQFYSGGPYAPTNWCLPSEITVVSTYALPIGRKNFAPYIFNIDTKVIEWMSRTQTAAAGSTVSAALCQRIGQTEYRVIHDLGTIDTSTTGDKVYPRGKNVVIPAGFYYMMIVSAGGTPALNSYTPELSFQNGSSFGTPYRVAFKNEEESSPFNPVQTAVTGAVNNQQMPCVFFREI